MAKSYSESSKKATLKYQRTLKHFTIRVKPEIYNDVSEYAKAKEIPIRQLVLRAIEEYRENHPV